MDDLWQFNLIGSSAVMEEVRLQIRRLSQVEVGVLIDGETGTGKELAARAIHYLGRRCDEPFVPVNCGALSDSLVESELFGHERGAFTDAKSQSHGLVGQARGGTLFLDEVEVLSPKAQAVLLRFLQDRTYRRVGGSTLMHADVRVLTASNVDLEEMVRVRQFRADLFYRMNLLTLRMPPLRERMGDAQELAEIFLARLSHQYRAPEKRLHAAAVDFIAGYSWPGNVRELENVVHREFLMTDGEEVKLGYKRSVVERGKAPGAGTARYKEAKAQVLVEFERRYVREILERTEGNISRAARLAGKDRSAFGKLARKHGFGK